MRAKIHEYLHAIQVGRTDIPGWRTWCVKHQKELTELLGRQRFLQWKFSPRAQLPAVVDDLELRHLDLATLDRRLLRADSDTWRSIECDHPAAEAYRNGDWRLGDALLLDDARSLHDRVSTSGATDTDAAQEFSELVYDAIAMLVDGDVRFATGLLLGLASLDDAVDMIGASILEARALLESFGGYHSRIGARTSRSWASDSSLRDIRPGASALASILSWHRAPDAELRTNQQRVQSALRLARAAEVESREIASLQRRVDALL